MGQIKRLAVRYLDEWRTRATRKPLIMRGARQVGKTYLAESWGRKNFEVTVTANLEREPHLAKVFNLRDPRLIIQQLSLIKGVNIVPGKTLLVIDEIQSNESALGSLRYFFEELPELHVLATGSLLDFALRELASSAPVGRIEYLYLNPLTFAEFVRAVHSEELGDFLNLVDRHEQITSALHETLLDLLRTYYFIGGMPEAVHAYVTTKDLVDVQRIQASILATFQDDFAKYRSRLDIDVVRTVFDHCTRWPSRRVKYSEISRGYRASQIQRAFELLSYARLVNRAYVSAANGVPLAAEENIGRFKPVFLDIGLCNRACGLPLQQNHSELLTVREGALAEQFVAQELLTNFAPFEPPQLHYWEEPSPSSAAEVDFVIASNNDLVPIEVKAAQRGALRSLQIFLQKKHRPLGVRLSAREGAVEDLNYPDAKCTLLSIPLYLAARTDAFCRHWSKV